MDFPIDNDSAAYKALRVYRNAFLSYVRVRLDAEFGTSLDLEIETLFVKEWSDISKSVIHASSTGVTQRNVRDALDHLGVAHFKVLLEKYWDLLGPSDEPLSDLGKKQKTQIALWASEIASIRNPIAHPPEADLPLRDTLRLVDTAARILSVLEIDEEQSLRELWSALLSESVSSSLAPPEVLDTLPSREQITEEFVGRKEELATLWRWLEGSERRVWALVGDGGKGKTTVAFQFAKLVRPHLPEFGLQGVLWLTAKRRRFVEGNAAQVASTDFTDLDTALNWILQAMGWDEDVLGSTETKLRKCRELLNEFPMLIVADDVDSLEADEEQAVEFFVHTVPQTHSKVLITSRRRVFGLGSATTTIHGMSESEVRELVMRRGAVLGLQLDLAERKVREIRNATDGSPLYIEDLLRLAHFYSLEQAISQWNGRDGDSAREYSLRRELEKLSNDAQNVLSVLAYSEAPLSVDECAVVWGISRERTFSAMDELKNWNLLIRPGLVEDLPRFSCSRNLAKLMKRSLKSTDQEQRVRNGIKSLRGVGVATSKTRSFIQQAVALQQGGHQEDAERVLLQGAETVPNSGDILSMLGWLYSKWAPQPRVADAEEHFKRAEGLGRANRHLYAHWADMEFRRGEFRAAAEICDRAVGSVAKGDAFTWRLGGSALTKLGVLHRQSLSTEQAKECFAKARKYLMTAHDLAHEAGEISRVFKARRDLAVALNDEVYLRDVHNEWALRLPDDPFR